MAELHLKYMKAERMEANVRIVDTSLVTFVAKIQKAKTRKNKNYFVLRTTIPKSVAEKMEAKAGDYLFFKTKKAQWYHMLDWGVMGKTWEMLPKEIRNQLIMDGLSNQRGLDQTTLFPGATNLSAPTLQNTEMEVSQKW